MAALVRKGNGDVRTRNCGTREEGGEGHTADSGELGKHKVRKGRRGRDGGEGGGYAHIARVLMYVVQPIAQPIIPAEGKKRVLVLGWRAGRKTTPTRAAGDAARIPPSPRARAEQQTKAKGEGEVQAAYRNQAGWLPQRHASSFCDAPIIGQVSGVNSQIRLVSTFFIPGMAEGTHNGRPFNHRMPLPAFAKGSVQLATRSPTGPTTSTRY